MSASPRQISRHRYELEIGGIADPVPGSQARWVGYEFHGKPGDPRRRPPQVAPYHLGLDWLMWFAALSPALPDPDELRRDPQRGEERG